MYDALISLSAVLHYEENVSGVTYFEQFDTRRHFWLFYKLLCFVHTF